MNKLRVDPRFAFKNTDEDRAKVLKEYKDDVARALAAAPKYFSKLPKAPVEVRAVPKYAEQGEAGAYYNQPALDGSRPGIVFVNLRDVTENPSWANHTTAFHEGVPGHHFQLALAQEIQGMPMLRRVFTPASFAEGWALYSERFAKEMGMYDNDPFGDLGRLRDELFRATRLVVDTGMHAKHWSREQAIDYMMKTTGMAESGRHRRNRALRRVAGPSLRLQDRHEDHSRHARQGEDRARRQVRSQGLPRRRAAQWRHAARRVPEVD